MRVVRALNDYLRVTLGGKCVYSVHDQRLIGFEGALLPRELPADVYPPGAEQLGQVEGELRRLARVFEHDAVSSLPVGAAEGGREVRMLPGVGVFFRRDAGGEVLRAEQLPGVELPAVHEEGGLLRLSLEHVVPPAARERRGVFVVPAVEAEKGQRP